MNMEGRPFLSNSEDHYTFMIWNNTDREYPLDRCLHELIEEQVKQNPGRSAVCFGEEQVCFAELNLRSNRCAQYLRGVGVGPDTIVGVLMERSLEMVIALLGVLKAGGAYLPLEPTDPGERLRFMLEDARVSIVFTRGKYKDLVPGFEGTMFCLDSEWDYLFEENGSNFERIITPDNIVYVIYTSGSTGKPKGCMVSHKAICNRLLWMQDKYRLTDRDRVLQKTPFTFDVSVWEFFWPLLAGASLVLAKPGGHKDSHYLVEKIIKEGITTCHFVPSMLRFFINDPNVSKCDTLRRVFASGEVLSFDLMINFKQQLSAALHNLYGPTEAAVDVTYWECEERTDKKVPIGRPISNIKIYILDSKLNQVPIGKEGELFIGGIGLAGGYLYRPGLSAEKFIHNPFDAKPGTKLYKTGDKARYLPDGNIEFLGRIDFQVKVRGHRIELGEIETILRDHEAVEEAVVLVKDREKGDPKLVAYIAARDELPGSMEIREFVKRKLPGYMVPNFFVPLDSIPVTHHGKIDRSALPWPIKSGIWEPKKVTKTKSKANDGEAISTVLLGYVEDALLTTGLRIDDDLFNCGATSFTMVRVVEKIHKKYHVTVPVEVFLDDPTIEAIADYIRKELGNRDDEGDEDKPQDIEEPSQMDPGLKGNYREMAGPGKVIKLQEVAFRKAAYMKGSIKRDYTGTAIPFNLFSRLLSLLKQETLKGEPKYLYPSAGGLNAVQTYLYIKETGAAGVDKGIYYYHPEEHALYLIDTRPVIDRSIFFEYDRPVFDTAGFVLFFIARLEAIKPVYQMVSPLLVTLDAGYMGQLMLSRQEDFNVGLCPTVGVDFDSISDFFRLDNSHRLIHCMLGGVPHDLPAKFHGNGLINTLQKTGKTITGHFQNYTDAKTGDSFLDFGSMSTWVNMKFLTKEAHDRFLKKRAHIRRFPGDDVVLELDKHDFMESDYRLRSCQRDYLDKPVPFDRFSKFLSLLKQENIESKPLHLYPLLAGTYAIQVYLYIKENGVEGIAQGIYYYHPVKHVLVPITSKLSKAMRSCYTPFNRRHYLGSKFCLFLLGHLKAIKPVYKEESLYLASLEAGYMGQLLMDKQAEFEMGVCPIGGLRFDRIRPDFKLADGDELLHSFTCGSVKQEIPKNREFLEIGRGETETIKKRTVLQQDIAIVGISGRYPGAESLDEYWENLKGGKNSFRELPENRKKLWKQDGSEPGGPQISSIRGGFLENIDCFDSLLFNISPPESRTMDPQERLFLEVAWECLENGGYTAENLVRSSEKVGVFVGAMWNDYQNQGAHLWRDMKSAQVHPLAIHSSIANRISYFFNFSGPSIALNTSCSSAITAIHAACESIKRGECDAALVGGVNLMAHPYHRDSLASLDLLSKDNECRPFGAQATGWVPGEGIGAILIKPIEDAERDKDHIHGIIKGTAVGHGGRSAQFGAPNWKMQAKSIQKAITDADVSIGSIRYIEAAAPGAGIADASEMSAIKKVFQNFNDASSPLLIGSVKGNIGHLESASAMSQITKVLLQMKHGQVAPTINFKPINPLIQLQGSGLEIADRLKPWSGQSKKHLPFRALINAFGASGSMGHIILEQYVGRKNKQRDKAKPTIILLSAATKEQLTQQVSKLYDFLAQKQTFHISDIGYTLQMGRVEMEERLAIVATNTRSLRKKLGMFLKGEEPAADLYQGSAVAGAECPFKKGKNDLLFMAEQWVQGAKIEWSDLNDGSERRIPLPTYPFAKERHWVNEHPGKCGQESDSTSHKGLGRTPGENILLSKAEDYLKISFARVSEIPVSRIHTTAALEKYGISSLMIKQLNTTLETDFGELSKTLFFEYQTIHELAKYFMEHHQERLKVLLDYPGPLVNSYPDESFERKLTQKQEREGEIAIIGLSGRYPKAGTTAAYWENLKNGIDCITEIPKQRWDHEKYYDPDKRTPGKTYSKWGGFIDDIDKFDPLFFNISPREAEIMDPQERLFLETVWHTFEDAGYNRHSLKRVFDGKVGIFVGVMYGEYQLFSELNNNKSSDTFSLVSSYGSIANRVSYFFDFHGPSMAVDTMCSSSLTALHLAVESIKRGECESAIAGGVNISIHPNKYIAHSRLAMSSSDGRCRSFGEGGDGFVPGEGVGAVLLKPLKKACRDGDHIYGVIKGISINHGGKTNGYTVPNPTAQSDLIAAALKKGEIDPRTISYVEAHGTGTSLGDPIEITGLSKRFAADTNEKQYCSIGSVKSNIGHLESAAGIASLTKVLLQMKYKQLVPSLHSKQLNPDINFEKSPFFVQQELTHWSRPVIETNGKSKVYPRRASISSFGAGGANAHVVVEEFEVSYNEPVKQDRGLQIIVLSAKNKERLQEYTQQLLAAIQEGQFPGNNLPNMAYTLQVGREAMEERLAVIVGSLKELREKLEVFLDGQDNIAGLYRGQIKHYRETFAVFAADEDMAKTIDAWITKGKYAELADLWVKGLIFDWERLYGDSKPCRISLPTYPFARERCWVPGIDTRAITTSASYLHSLLHQNTSDLLGPRFSSTFTGREFFLADHVVKGERVLPGVAYLEIARAAVAHAEGVLEEDQMGIRLKNVVWARPIAVGDQPVQVHIGLFPGDNGEVAYEIYSESEEVDAEPVVHSQGSVVLYPVAEVVEVPALDLPALQAQCSRRTLGSTQCYEAFRAIGIDYGPGYQGIKEVYVGSGQVLAKLSLPSSVSGTVDQFVLHPSLMDSALQASAFLTIGSGSSIKPLKPSLPFALEELEIHSKCTPMMWALVRSIDHSEAGGKVQKLDINLYNNQGTICIRIKGFSLRQPLIKSFCGGPGGSFSKKSPLVAEGKESLLMLQPCWKEQAAAREAAAPDYARHLVILCEPGEVSWESINAQMKGMQVRCLIFKSRQKNITKRFQAYTVRAFEEIQAILKEKPKGKVLIQVVVSTQDEQQLFSGLSGLLKTARQENPELIGQLIEIGEDSGSITGKLEENSRYPHDNQVQYRDGKRWVAGWSEIKTPGEDLGIRLPWKDRGIYLITGGAGGLGLIFAREIARRVKNVTLILTGRSLPGQERQAQLKELSALGARIEYKQVDVTQKKAVVGLIRSIREDFGSLQGIIHSAGVIRDNFILKKTKQEMLEVLGPKVAGVVNLDQAAKALSLDFFVLFSSTAGGIGSPGQADYSTANAFMDAYARYRNKLAASKQRYGQTLSINWPLWKEGGMQVDEETEKMMKQTMGMVPMQTSTGIRALYHGLASGKDQVMVMEGTLVQMKQKFLSVTTPPFPKPGKVPAAGIDTGSLVDHVQAVLKQAASRLLGVKIEDIDADVELDEYGFDPIMLAEFADTLNREYTLELNPIIFFEHPTLQSFAGYLVEEYEEVFLKRFHAAHLDQQSRRGAAKTSAVVEKSKAIPVIGHDLLREKGADYFKKLLSSVIKLPAHRIEADAPMEEYGIDSIMAMQLTNQLEKTFGSLPKTLFFEFQSIRELTGYFLESYGDQLAELPGIEEDAEGSTRDSKETAAATRSIKSASGNRRYPGFAAYGMKSREERAGDQDIAIIGLSGRYPQAENTREFWENLRDGKDCITEIPKERWDWQRYYGDPAKETDKTNIKWGGFIEGIGDFDPLFFGISPREAELMDPQQRLLMTYVWMALEDAGVTPKTLSQDTAGVFIAAAPGEYMDIVSIPKNNPLVMTVMAPSMMPNRISYALNLHGPSEYCETACSSTLVALHRAIRSIRCHECEQAIVGAVNLLLSPKGFIGFESMGYLSPAGEARPFQAGANGFVRCEGVGAMIIKPLQKAIKNHDHIYAVIKGTGVSHGGKGLSLTAPNAPGMKAAMIQAYQASGIDPRTVSYIEAHGIASPLADGIEINALKSGYRELAASYLQDSQAAPPCFISSLKPCIGHGEVVSGMAALSKVIAAINHRLIPGLPRFTTLHEDISLEGSPFQITAENRKWEALTDANGKPLPRRASINSYGFGGVNAHVVLEEYIPPQPQEETIHITSAVQPQIVLFSAKNPNRLQAVVQQMRAFIELQKEFSLSNLAYTLQVGREAMEYRAAMVTSTREELVQGLKEYLESDKEDKIAAASIPIFTGDPEEDHTGIKSLLSGKVGETVVQVLLAEKNLEKLALHWAQGGKIPWELLHEGEEVRRIPLPTYPFAKERYWLSSDRTTRRTASFQTDPGKSTRDNIKHYLTKVLSQELKIPIDQIKYNKNLQDYGVDSIVGLKLMRGFEEIFQLKMSGREMLEYTTVESLAGHLAGKADQGVNKKGKKTSKSELKKKSLIKTPLSEGQKGLWILQKFSPGMSAYNVPIAFRIKQEINPTLFGKACRFMLKQYPILGTVIREDNGVPYQTLHQARNVSFQQEKIEHLKEGEIIPFLRKKAKEPFHLETGPLMRIHLFSRSGQDYIVLITIHHIVFDGSSFLPFITTLLGTYRDLVQGKNPVPIPSSTSFDDFVEWEHKMLTGKEGEAHRSYWKQQLSGTLPTLELPTDRPCFSSRSFEGQTDTRLLSPGLSKRVKSFAQSQHMNLSIVFLGIFIVLVHRYTGQEDIIIGMPTMNRPHDRFDSLIGYFINMIAIRSQGVGTQSFSLFLRELQLTLVDGLDHGAYPFAALVRELNIPRTHARSPLFQTTFAYQNFLRPTGLQHFQDQYQDTLPIEFVEGIHQEGEYEFELEVFEQEDGFVLDIKYNPGLFDPATITRMMGHYVKLTGEVVDNPGLAPGEYPLLSKEEQKTILLDWNATQAEYPNDQCIHELFAQQVRKTPDPVALVYEEESLTYRELDEKSTRIALYLQGQGVSPGCLVGICVERSIEMILGILGILKAGGAYVPLDPDFPTGRLEYMVRDSKLSLVLTQPGLTGKMSQSIKNSTRAVVLDNHWQEIEHQASGQKTLNREIQSNHLAYVIYTSGSTGTPRGVMIEHRNVINHILSQKQEFNITEDERILQFSSINFDASVEQIWIAFFSGAALVLISKTILLNNRRFEKYILDKKVTHIHTVPMILKDININDKRHIKRVIAGGDICPVPAAKKWYNQCDFFNEYGPTETTVTSVEFRLMEINENQVTLPIGKPINNTNIYILDNYGMAVPIGRKGEIYIGGDGIARGYLNHPELTKETFVNNRFSNDCESRLYKTGDLGRYLPGGNIEFIGRIDDQVKIRGFRIELGEIESVINKIEQIQECVVLAKENKKGNKRLTAYIVTDGKKIDIQEIREEISKQLPDYMVPWLFVILESLPLTPNGKVDKKALPEPDGNIKTTTEYIAPRNSREQKLVDIWKDVLGVEKIGIYDNFFEWGGDSLLATQVVSKIHMELNVELPLKFLFEKPIISGLSEIIGNTKTGDLYPKISAASRDIYLPLSFAQERLWFLDRYEQNSSFYNMPGAFRLTGTLNVKALEKTFDEIINRHDVLRTNFVTVDDRTNQIIHKKTNRKLNKIDLTHLSKEEANKQAVESIGKEAQRSFNLENDSLLRTTLYIINKEENILFLNMHHIISDGWSFSILFNEISILYETFNQGKPSPLPEPGIQYADYAVWQRDYLKGEVLEKQTGYWKNKLSGAAVLELPTDYTRPIEQTFNGDTFPVLLNSEVTEKLNMVSKKYEVTLFMTLLSVFNVLLHKYTGQDDICVGTPIANRTRSEIEPLIGFFVNTLALRSDLSDNPQFNTLLEQVKETTLGAYDHQDIPFEKVVDVVQPDRNLSHSPLFQVMLVLQNTPKRSLSLPGLHLELEEIETHTSKFDITLSLNETGNDNGIYGTIEYNIDLFEERTIQQMATHFNVLVESTLKDSTGRISELEILSEEEKYAILEVSTGVQENVDANITIHQLFEEQVKKEPDRSASIFNNKTLSYRELNERSNRLARLLRKKGVTRDRVVGLHIERSFEMIIGILGILKAGGAYLPIDTEYPPERKRYILEDSEVTLLLTRNKIKGDRDYIPGHVEIVDPCHRGKYHGDLCNLNHINTGVDLVYLIYTSGSTGKPKGVMLEHRNVVNLIKYDHEYTNLDFSKLVQFHTISFDASFHEIFSVLLSGGELYLVDKKSRMDINELFHMVETHQVTTLFLPMSFLKVIFSSQESADLFPGCVRHIQTAGEQVLINDISRNYLKRNNVYLHNHYGPSETHVVTALTIDPAGEIPKIPSIGRPILNTGIYILDKYNHLLPTHIVGEIYIGGIQVGRGYWGKKELTGETFINNPYKENDRLYKTGDLGRWMPDGHIEFLGRIDDQVKIRGYRVEPGEIEPVINQIEHIQECVVLAKKDNYGNNQLIAYVVSNGKKINARELRDEISKQLPGYMVPSLFIGLERLPLTPNGKVDKKALPQPDGHIITTGYAAPRNSMEQTLVDIWKEVLGVEKIGIHDNFFELGGHSLKAAILAPKIHREFHVNVPLVEIFKTPTIRGLSGYIQETAVGKHTHIPISLVEKKEYYELSYNQERLWIIYQMSPGRSSYNLSETITLHHKIDPEIIKKTLYKIMERHESLRTGFKQVDNEPVQFVKESYEVKIPFKIIDISSMDKEEKEQTRAQISQQAITTPFLLTAVPLFTIVLVKLEEEQYDLIINMHHIISDGWSLEILKREFTLLYDGYRNDRTVESTPLKLQYKDFAAWQKQRLNNPDVKAKAHGYRLKTLQAGFPSLRLPYDFPGNPQDNRGGLYRYVIDKTIKDGLKQVTLEHQTTLFIVLFTVYNLMMSRLCGQEEIVCRAASAGRNHVSLHPIMGYFVNPVIVKNHVKETDSENFADLLQRVRSVLLEAFLYQEYTMERAVEELQVKPPGIDINFNMLNMSEGKTLTDPEDPDPCHTDSVTDEKFTITLQVIEYKDGIEMSWRYKKAFFKPQSIEHMCSLYMELLGQITRDNRLMSKVNKHFEKRLKELKSIEK